RRLLIGGFDGDEAHGFARHGLADRLGVGGVRLAALYERLDIGWRDQTHLVTKRGDLASPIVRTAAGLKANQTRRLLLEEPQHFRAVELPVENWRTLGVGAVDLKNLLGQIQPDGGNLLHGTAPTLWR